jgi:hypothetical protein
MTYEALIHAVAQLAVKLPPIAFRLLMHLIATAINEGTNEIQTSTLRLAVDMKCSRDKVRQAAQSLKPYMQVTAFNGTGYHFHMPPEWFEQSRGIFTPIADVEKRPKLPGNQAATCLVSRQLDPTSTHGTCLETRQLEAKERRIPGSYLPGNQAAHHPSCLETRQSLAQNQQLTDGADVDRSIGSIEIQYNSYESIEHIACAKTLTTDQRSDAIELSSWLRSYLREFGPPDQDQRAPDQQILARCLAVAPLGSLLSELKKMQQRCVRAGSQYAWFVTVFAQRLKGIPSNVLMAAYRDRAIQQRRRPQRDLDFSTRMTEEIRQRARRIG